MLWPWVVMLKEELDQLKAELARLKEQLEVTEELLAEAQREIRLQKESRFAAEHRAKALEAIREVKEKE